jgi:nitrite reductase/ring-hydroxylating ferredoxin subunit
VEEPVADVALRAALIEEAVRAVQASGYVRGRSLEQIETTLFDLLGRAAPTEREARMLRGMLKKVAGAENATGGCVTPLRCRNGRTWVRSRSFRVRSSTKYASARRPIALSYVDGTFSAVSGVCNHVGGPLGQGRIDAAGYITCSWHGWKFHHATGEGEPGFEDDRIPRHAVKVEGGRVLVHVKPETTRNKRPHPVHRPPGSARPR